MREAEGVRNAGQVNNGRRQHQAGQHGHPKHHVLPVQAEHAFALGAHVEGVENFGHAQCQEGHGHAVRAVHSLPHAAFHIVPNEVGRQRQRRHHQALVGNVHAHAAGKNAVACLARRAAHHVRLGLFQAQRQRGQGVGDEVHPQKVHRLQNGEAEQRGAEHGHHLAHVGAQQKLDGFADVVVNAAALAHGAHNGGKVIVCQHHVGHVLRHVCAGDAHAHANVCGLDAGRVVHAVARHGRHAAALAPGVYNAHLVLGLHARIHAELAHALFKLFVAQLVQLRAGDGGLFIVQNAKLPGNGNGGVAVVARNHHRADARLAALGNGGLHLGADGVYHARKAQEGKALFQVFGRGVLRGLGPRAHGAGQHAQGLIGHGLVRGQHLAAQRRRQGHGLAALPNVRAAAQHFVRRALGVLHAAIGRFVHSAHHFAHAVKRGLAHAGGFALQRGLFQAQARGPVHQRGLGGLAHGGARVVGPGVAAQAGGARGQRLVAPVLYHRHFVLRQRARFIRAYHLCAAQRLHSRKAADDGVALGHVGDANGKHHRHHRGQPLRNGGHSQADGHHEGGQHHVKVEIARANQAERKHKHADAQHQPGKHAAKLRKLFLQRRLAVLGVFQGGGNFAHLGVHARLRHHGLPAAVHHGRAHIHHVAPVAQRHVFGAGLQGQRAGVLFHRHALARQGGLFHLQAGAFQHAGVGGHGVARLQHHHIAGHQLLAFQRQLFAAAQHLAGGGRHLLQGLYGLFGLAFLIHAQHGVDAHHRQNDDDVCKAFARNDGRHGAYGGRAQQNDNHGVCQLFQQPAPHGRLFALGQLVGPVLRKAAGRLGLAQAPGRAGKRLQGFLLCLRVILQKMPRPFRDAAGRARQNVRHAWAFPRCAGAIHEKRPTHSYELHMSLVL